MKLFVKILAWGAVVGLISWAMLYIGADENSIRLNGDWGIAKDKPLR
jgi:hypothetical protein